MNREEKHIVQYFQEMKLPLNLRVLEQYSNLEKHHLERLCERMSYLHSQLMDEKISRSDNRRSFLKDEFRALEWILWEMGLTETYLKLDL